MVHQIHLAADASQEHAILSNKIVGTENALNFATYPGTESQMLFWLKGFKFNWAVFFFCVVETIQYHPHKPHKNYVRVPWRMRGVSEFQETQLALLVPLVACKPKLLVIVQCHGCLLMAPHKGSNQCLKASQLLRQIWAANGDLGWDWQTEDPICINWPFKFEHKYDSLLLTLFLSSVFLSLINLPWFCESLKIHQIVSLVTHPSTSTASEPKYCHDTEHKGSFELS